MCSHLCSVITFSFRHHLPRMVSHHRSMGSPLLLSRLPLFLFLSFSLLRSSAADDLASDRAALIAFRATVSGATIRWNTSDAAPCGWRGVNCSANRVRELRLPGSGLSGSIPPGTLGNLTALETLSLRNNLLSGTLPQDFAALSGLRLLHLENNRLSGEIPTSVFALRQLVRLNLGGNNLDGGIDLAFNNLTFLTELFLDRNRLAGDIPDLRLPGLVRFNVSFNQLNGSIPAILRGFPASSFTGNSLCGGPLGTCPGEFPPSPAPSPSNSGTIPNGRGGSKKLSARAITGIAIGSAVGFLILLLLVVFYCRKPEKGETAKPKEVSNKLHPKADMSDESSTPTSVTMAPSSVSGRAAAVGRRLVFTGKMQGIYDLEDLLRASAEVIGKGTTGTTYEAILEMGMAVAVKRLRDVDLPEKEFSKRMEAIGAMDHPNLVALQAYYCSKDDKLLVYEIVPNGSLCSNLHGNKLSGCAPLDWETRLGIALGAARGIEFIHFQGSHYSHGNIKSSNVILTGSFNARVSDVGMSNLGPVAMPNQRSGYCAPEVREVGKVSQKADVYSFGVLLMELLTGKPPTTQAVHNEDGFDLPLWVQNMERENWSSKVFDLELFRSQKDEEEMAQLTVLAIDCTSQFPESRPSMSEVVTRIEKICSNSGRNPHQNTQFHGTTGMIPNRDCVNY